MKMETEEGGRSIVDKEQNLHRGSKATHQKMEIWHY